MVGAVSEECCGRVPPDALGGCHRKRCIPHPTSNVVIMYKLVTGWKFPWPKNFRDAKVEYQRAQQRQWKSRYQRGESHRLLKRSWLFTSLCHLNRVSRGSLNTGAWLGYRRELGYGWHGFLQAVSDRRGALSKEKPRNIV